MNELKKLLALFLTITSPIWFIPYMTFVVLVFAIIYVSDGFSELYKRMLTLLGAKQ